MANLSFSYIFYELFMNASQFYLSLRLDNNSLTSILNEDHHNPGVCKSYKDR